MINEMLERFRSLFKKKDQTAEEVKPQVKTIKEVDVKTVATEVEVEKPKKRKPRKRVKPADTETK